eukprot:Amastigsp_a1196_6.p3 type:complete len:147 gc:universal Amastigsp_a1196_6:1-441(+)
MGQYQRAERLARDASIDLLYDPWLVCHVCSARAWRARCVRVRGGCGAPCLERCCDELCCGETDAGCCGALRLGLAVAGSRLCRWHCAQWRFSRSDWSRLGFCCSSSPLGCGADHGAKPPARVRGRRHFPRCFCRIGRVFVCVPRSA